MKIFTNFSLKNVSAIIILCILVLIGGTYSVLSLKKETMPDINIPIVSVVTVYPGASPSDIQNRLTIPLENLISNVEGVKNINSTSSENFSSIVVEFDYSSDMNEKQKKVEDSIKSIKLPDNVESPKIMRINFSAMPSLNLSISDDKLKPEELEKKIRDKILPNLTAIEGVGQVQIASESKESIYIKLDTAKLKKYNITSQTITQLIQANNISIPSGSLNINDTIEPIRISGNIKTFKELKNMILIPMQSTSTSSSPLNTNKLLSGMTENSFLKSSPANTLDKNLVSSNLLKLSDIADISIGTGNVSNYSRTNGNPSVVLKVIKTQDSNTIDVSDSVKKKLNTLIKTIPGNPKISIILDQSDYVKESINGMLKEGIFGAIFAFIVILLFLRNFRTTIIACVSIPLSILIALIVLKQFDVTLNILTLGGLSVAVGRIVDDSIVVIENIYRRLQSDDIRSIDLLRISTKEVSSAITASTLTTVSVFLPVAFVDGLAGVMFKPFSLTLAAAMLSSLLVAITVIPVLSKILLLKTKKIKHSDFHEGKIMKIYENLLSWSLNHKIITLFIALVLFSGSIVLIPFIGTSFVQQQKEQYINISLDYPAGTNTKIINNQALKIEKTLSSIKNIEKYQTTIGSSTDDAVSVLMNNGSGNILAQLKTGSNVDSVIKSLEKKVPSKSGKGKFTIQQANPNSSSTSNVNSIEINVMGNNSEKIKNTAKLLTTELKKIKGLEQVTNNVAESKPEIAVNVDQKKSTMYGLSAAQVGMTVRELLNDSKISNIVVENNNLEVKLGLKIDPFKKVKDIEEIPLTSPMGSTVKIKDIADVSELPGPVSVFSLNNKEYAKVSGKITVKDTGAISNKVQKKIDKFILPSGVKVKIAGITEMMGDTFTQMGLAMIIAIFFVFLVMLIALGSASAPFSILFSLPLAAIGGLSALFISRLPIDMPSMIGGLMLIGIVVTNAIVLIDRVQQKRKEGMSVRNSLMEAGRVRMRPILMTAIATIAALIPLALGLSKGSTMSQSLAVIVIGGLTTSTFLTLIIVPVVYELLENIKFKLFKRDTLLSEK